MAQHSAARHSMAQHSAAWPAQCWLMYRCYQCSEQQIYIIHAPLLRIRLCGRAVNRLELVLVHVQMRHCSLRIALSSSLRARVMQVSHLVLFLQLKLSSRARFDLVIIYLVFPGHELPRRMSNRLREGASWCTFAKPYEPSTTNDSIGKP